ncbi:MAG: hypothetical protein K6D96_05905 [Acetatifactor sp.]|nr:hypothetical protein [Acetatifactor sp.]
MKDSGSVGEFITCLICLLAMTVLMEAFMGNIGAIQKKLHISQCARKYMLIMETEGYLSEEAKGGLLAELEQLGLKEVSLMESTVNPTDHGNEIVLHIRGKMDEYEVDEKRFSVSKN